MQLIVRWMGIDGEPNRSVAEAVTDIAFCALEARRFQIKNRTERMLLVDSGDDEAIFKVLELIHPRDQWIVAPDKEYCCGN